MMVVTMMVMVVLIGCGVVWYHRLIAGGAGRGYRGSRYRLPHAYSHAKDHMAMASVRMHGRRRETPRQHRAVQRPTQQRVRERVSVEGEGWGWGEEGETETATEGEDEGEGGGRVWRVRGPLVAGGRGWASSGVVWHHRLIETGECGAGDGVVLVVVAVKRRTTQGQGA